MSKMDPMKKRYGCSHCDAEFLQKSDANKHIKKKNPCNNDISDIHITTTEYTKCLICDTKVKTMTTVNFP
jgi:hypothetical protein